MEPSEREALILEYMPVVDRIVGVLQRSGLPTNVEVDDLRLEGYLALIRTIDTYVPLDRRRAQVLRRVKDACLDYLKDEARYSGVHISFETAGIVDEKTGEMLV